MIVLVINVWKKKDGQKKRKKSKMKDKAVEEGLKHLDKHKIKIAQYWTNKITKEDLELVNAFKITSQKARGELIDEIEEKSKKNLKDMNVWGITEFKKGYQRALLELKEQLKREKE